LERKFTDQKVRGSNPTSASRLPLSRLGQPGSIPALVLPSGGMAARHRKSATAERFFFCKEVAVSSHIWKRLTCGSASHSVAKRFVRNLRGPGKRREKRLRTSAWGARWLKWLEREFTDRKVRGSNPTFASRFPLSRLGQPGSIPASVLPSGGMAARHRVLQLNNFYFLHHGKVQSLSDGSPWMHERHWGRDWAMCDNVSKH
ncbi:hypothetical protein CSKR_101515, partial [Clonorchis sinensis]